MSSSATPARQETRASLAARLLQAGEAHPWMLFAAITLIWIPAAVGIAVTRRLWYDELFTLNLSQLGNWPQIWQALRSGVDLQPPLVYIVSRFFERWFGVNEFGLRAQAIASFALASTCLFFIGRRRLGAWYGALCAALMLVSAAYPYSTEGRPYAMLLACSSMALVCWIGYRANGRSIALVGLALAIALTVSTQYYGAFTVIPLWAGEVYEWRRTRWLDRKVLLATLLGLTPLLFFLPLIRGSIALHGQRPWNPVTLRSFFDIYVDLISPMAVPVAVAAVLLFFLASRVHITAPQPTKQSLSGVTIVIVCYIAIPIPAILAALVGSHMIYWRYLMPAVIGLVLIAAEILHWLSNGMRGPAAAATLCCLAWFAYANGRGYQKFFSHGPPPGAITLPVPNNDLPVIVNSPLDYVQLMHYAESSLKRRLVYVADPDYAARIAGTDALEKNVMIAAPVFSLRVLSLREFERKYPEFMLYVGPSTVGWFAQEMIDKGAKLEVYSREGHNFVYQGHTPVQDSR